MSDSCDHMDCSLPGASVHGILQARILEWVAIFFSRGSSWPRDQTQVSCTTGRLFTNWATREALKWNLLSRVQLFVTPSTIQPMEFSRPEYPNPGIKPRSPALQEDSLPVEPQRRPKNTGVGSLSLLQQIFLTQESNHGLLHCRWILYQLSFF